MEELTNKIYGLFYGAALGDALGVPFEFYLKVDKWEKKIIPNFKNRHGTNSHGTISDDTEMAICIISSLVENNGEYNQRDVIEKYIKWARRSYNAGKNTKALLAVKDYEEYIQRTNEVFKDAENIQSNGSLMRCFPLFLSNNEDIINDCYITNPNFFNLECEVIFISLLRIAYNFGHDKIGSKQKIIEYLTTFNYTNEQIKNYVNYAINKTYIDLSINKGHVINALYAAIYCILHFNTYIDGIDWIIREHNNSDTDTNCCIAGALMGIYYGYNNLDQNENITALFDIKTSRPKMFQIQNTPNMLNFWIQLIYKKYTS